MKKKLCSFCFVFIGIFFLLCNSIIFADPPKPKLTVIIVVDQLRYDYLIRYSGLFKSGFAKLINEGAYFTEAYHDHAFTSTAPGHATIATGCFPSKHGIISNDYYEQSSQSFVYSCSDSAARILGNPEMKGISPRRLLRNGISDWLKTSNKKNKVYSVSIKDRSSVLLGGQNPDGVFWYNDNSGKYITSEYYMKSYPEWVDSFNASGIVLKHFNNDWEKLLDEDYYLISREDDFTFENDRVGRTFPHHLKKSTNDKKLFFELLPYSPFGEEINFDFAKTVVENENLGGDNNPDLLFIGCSPGDKLGHDFGPLSQEMQDYYLRLDEYTGDFIKYLDQKIGKDNYVITLSSDHGVSTMPEELARRGYDAARVHSSEIKKQYHEAAEEVQKKYGLTKSIVRLTASNGIVLNYDEAEQKNISNAELRKALAENLKKIYFVADTYTVEELKSEGNKEFLQNYKNSFMRERSYEIIIRPKKNYTINHDKHGVNHGTPYDYDSHVPVIFYGSGIKPGKINERIVTVDIAPTLADLLEIKYDEDIDGKSLLKMIEGK